MKTGILVGISLGSLMLATTASGQASGQQRGAEAAAKKRSLEEALTNPIPGGSPLLGPVNTTPVGAPIVAFKGCAAPKGGSGASADTSDRMRTRQSSQTDPVTARVFAAQEITQPHASQETMEQDCRYRFDGVWVQDVQPQFDKSKAALARVSTSGPSLAPELTYAAYTDPVYMYIDMSENGQTLSLRPATSNHKPLLLRSRDGIPLSQVLRPNGRVKTYYTVVKPETPLQVNVTRFGKMRLRWAKQDFVRPAPTVSAKADVSAGDVFAVGYNLDNLEASLRGYDIVKQNPMKLNNNDGGLGRVFAKADPLDYAIIEKRTVPLGLKLDPHGDQGTSMKSTLMSSQSQFQKTVTTSLGVSVGFTALNPKGEALPAKGSASAGVDYVKSKTRGMSAGIRNSMASKIARHRMYSLLLDRPFAQLSQEFIEAIDDADRFGRYDQLIAKFGTHYPRAVTYGSAAWKHNSYSESTIARWRADSEDINTNIGGSLGGFSLNIKAGRFTETEASSSSMTGVSVVESDAVGGTGAEESGTGVPYPILADLRPLHELLNPLNFPNEPRIYGEVRNKLALTIANYLNENADQVSSASVGPEQQTWTITSRWIQCIHSGFEGPSISIPDIQLAGTIRLNSIETPPGRPATPSVYPFRAKWDSYVEWPCGKGSDAIYKTRDSSNSLTVIGNVEQIKKYAFRYRAELWERDWFPDPHSEQFNMNSPHLRIPAKANSKVGDYYTRTWEIKHRFPHYPILVVNTRMERIK